MDQHKTEAEIELLLIETRKLYDEAYKTHEETLILQKKTYKLLTIVKWSYFMAGVFAVLLGMVLGKYVF